ncbi:Zuotin [Cucumispora dikerogammari]|nr:Zuotin [Cucumispora dikerogammari]
MSSIETQIELNKMTEELQKKYKEYTESRDIKKYENTEAFKQKDFKRLNLYMFFNIDGFRNIDSNNFNKVLHKNYIRKLNKYHPDKSSEDKTFSEAIGYAYRVLGDPFWRKKYDDFYINEDLMPWSDMFIYKDELKEMNPAMFFIIFPKILSEYEKHSKNKKPAPPIGNMNSTAVDVQRFYKYWDTFESNRSFDIIIFFDGIESMHKSQFEDHTKSKSAEKTKYFSDHMVQFKSVIKLLKESDPRISQIKKESNFIDADFCEEDLKNLQKCVKQFTRGRSIAWPFIQKNFVLKNGKNIPLIKIQKKYEEIKNKKI